MLFFCQLVCSVALLVAIVQSVPLRLPINGLDGATQSAGRLSLSLFGRSPHTIGHPLQDNSLLSVKLDALVGDFDLKLLKRGWTSPFDAFHSLSQHAPGISSLSNPTKADSMLSKIPFADSLPKLW